jgi:hypothetical protein
MHRLQAILHHPTLDRADGPQESRQQWGSSGTFLGLPVASMCTSVKQPKGHLRRSAARCLLTWQVKAPPGLFRNI